MRAAIYARYSSENQRPESIEDQIGACRRLAKERSFVVLDDHIYSDKAQSGARKDRPGLNSLIAAAPNGGFDAVLVDDLSRLARDNHLMLSVIAELHFEGIRVISVADGLDSDDEEATLGIQVRGIFNELQLRDLRKKTLRGQMGQKERGFFVGERTFGYCSVPVGEMRMDKKGRPRPDGYSMEIEPREAATVLRIFKAYAGGASLLAIARKLNTDGVVGQIRSAKGWSPSTVSRMLDNEKYRGRWVWNRSESRRDPRTGRRRRFEKPESEWIVREDEALRIVPKELWEAVRERRQEMKRTWPGGKGKRGFSAGQKSSERHFPTHLLSGAMACGSCGGTIGQVSGKGGGYYGCLRAARGGCENKIRIRRKLAEKVILEAVRERISDPEQIRRILEGVEKEVRRLRSDAPEAIRLKESELVIEERRLANFLDFVGEGRGSRALAEALVATERKVEALREEVEALRASQEKVFRPPPIEWIRERVTELQSTLELRIPRSALILRDLLGPIKLEPVEPDIGRPYYRATTSLDTLALLEPPSGESSSEGGANTLRQWRRRELHPRPRNLPRCVYERSQRSLVSASG